MYFNLLIESYKLYIFNSLLISFDFLSWNTYVILKYCIVDEYIEEIGQLELQFASMNICSAESTINTEMIEV